jgi:hypothetical protein
MDAAHFICSYDASLDVYQLAVAGRWYALTAEAFDRLRAELGKAASDPARRAPVTLRLGEDQTLTLEGPGPEDFAAFLEVCNATAPGTGQERRGSPRSEPGRLLACRLTPPGGGVGPMALVRNLSSRGVALLLPRPPEPGTTVSLYPLYGAFDPIPLTIVHVRQVAGGYLVGCAFDASLTPEELTSVLDLP